jgi:histidinol-phosphatase
VTGFLDIALRAIREADKITLSYYGKNPRSHLKEDRSPVTIADTRAERAIVRTIRKKFPGHDFYGEEYGRTGRQSDYLWLIDPIDGTKNYIGGIPLWGTLIALMRGDELILGVSHVPILKETLWAENGRGAFLNGKRVRVSRVGTLGKAMISYGSLGTFRAHRLEKNILSLIHACSRQRCFGDLWPYHLLASGKLEIVIEMRIKPMDIAPHALIVREAGGETTDIGGKLFSLSTDSFLATNGMLHETSLRYFERVHKPKRA